jgi:hypothetical protein
MRSQRVTGRCAPRTVRTYVRGWTRHRLDSENPMQNSISEIQTGWILDATLHYSVQNLVASAASRKARRLVDIPHFPHIRACIMCRHTKTFLQAQEIIKKLYYIMECL